MWKSKVKSKRLSNSMNANFKMIPRLPLFHKVDYIPLHQNSIFKNNNSGMSTLNKINHFLEHPDAVGRRIFSDNNITR
jgi:hypothetical protein